MTGLGMMMMLKTDTLSEAFMGAGWKCTETVPPSLLTSLSSVSNVRRKRRSAMKMKAESGESRCFCTQWRTSQCESWTALRPHLLLRMSDRTAATFRWVKALMHCHRRSPLSCLDLPPPSVLVRQDRTESRTNALDRFSMGHSLV